MTALINTVMKMLNDSNNPEEEALNLLIQLQERFDWTGVMFTRQDVETYVGQGLTDEEWNRVNVTKPWRDAHSIILEGGGWEPLYMAVDEAGINL
jgi:hypothetical protein